MTGDYVRDSADAYAREVAAFCAAVLDQAADAVGHWAHVVHRATAHLPSATNSYLVLAEHATDTENAGHVVNGAALTMACQTINTQPIPGLPPPWRREILLAYMCRQPDRITPEIADALVQIAVFREVVHRPAQAGAPPASPGGAP